MTKRRTSNEIASSILDRHNGMIDLSEFKYVDKSTACTFICNKCGNKWDSLPFVVVRGKGCPRCDAMKVAEIGKKKFGDRFSYENTLSTYNGMKEKCLFHCNKHNVDFYTEPFIHLSSKNGGCRECANEDDSTRHKHDLGWFISRCKSKFGDKFEFDESVYESANSDIVITCKSHGNFITTPKRFLSSEFGCNKCSRDNSRISSIVWVNRFKKIHGDRYDYSESEFGKVDDKIAIRCREHGVFYQTPHNHAKGEGCPTCMKNSSALEESVAIGLDKDGIRYERQKRFQWLGRMSLDFYVPSCNVAIECQGIQHYEPIEFFGGDDKLEYVKSNDALKYKLACENGVDLIYLCNTRNKDDDANDGKTCFSTVNGIVKYINSLNEGIACNGKEESSEE